MAPLPDPTPLLSGDDRALYEHLAQARAGAEGRAALGDVYVVLLNNPAVTAKIGALGEQLRFHGVLPDALRELAILRFAARNRLGYVWAHHQRPARLAGLAAEVIDGLVHGPVDRRAASGAERRVVTGVHGAAGDHDPAPDLSRSAASIPSSLDPMEAAVVVAVDAVVEHRSIPADVQSRIVDAHGTAAVVELVALCGLYAIMGYTCAAFEVEVEPGFPPPPF